WSAPPRPSARRAIAGGGRPAKDVVSPASPRRAKSPPHYHSLKEVAMTDSKRVTVAVVSVVSGAVLSLLAALPAGATPQMLSQAKTGGSPVQKCTNCHTVAALQKER